MNDFYSSFKNFTESLEILIRLRQLGIFLLFIGKIELVSSGRTNPTSGSLHRRHHLWFRAKMVKSKSIYNYKENSIASKLLLKNR